MELHGVVSVRLLSRIACCVENTCKLPPISKGPFV